MIASVSGKVAAVGPDVARSSRSAGVGARALVHPLTLAGLRVGEPATLVDRRSSYARPS